MMMRFVCFLLVLALTPLTVPLCAQDVYREVLPNGVTLVVAEHHVTGLVSVEAFVRAGPSYESELQGTGVSALVESMLRGSPAVRGDLQRLGNAVSSETDVGWTSYRLMATRNDMSEAVQTMSRWIGASGNFDEQTFQRAVQQQQRAQEQSQQDATSFLAQAVRSALYQRDAARLPVLGSPELLSMLTLPQVQTYYNKRYTASHIVLVVTGNVQTEAVRVAATTAFTGFPIGSEQREDERRIEAEQLHPRDHAMYSPSLSPALNENRVYLAWQTVGLGHPDQPALELLAQYLDDSDLRVQMTAKQIARHFKVEHVAPVGRPGYLLVSYDVRDAERGEAYRLFHESMPRIAADIQKTALLHRRYRKLTQGNRAGEMPPADVEHLESASQVLSHLVSRLEANRRTRLLVEISRDLGMWELAVRDATVGEQLSSLYTQVDASRMGAVVSRYIRGSGFTRFVVRPGEDPKKVEQTTEIRVEPKAPVVDIDPVVNSYRKVRLLTHSMPSLGVCWLRMSCGGGSRVEQDGEHGSGLLLARLLGVESAKYETDVLRTLLRERNMSLKVEHTSNGLHMTVRCFRTDAAEALEMLCDAMVRPVLNNERLVEGQQEIETQLAELARFDGEWSAIIQQLIRENMYQDHYAGIALDDLQTSVADLRPEALEKFHKKLLHGGNVIISAIGDFDEEEVIDVVEDSMLRYKEFRVAPLSIPDLSEPVKTAGNGAEAAPVENTGGSTTNAERVRVDKRSWSREQSACGLAWSTPSLDDDAKTRAIMDVLAAVVIGGNGSELLGGRLGFAIEQATEGMVSSRHAHLEYYHGRGALVLSLLLNGGTVESIRDDIIQSALDRLLADLKITKKRAAEDGGQEMPEIITFSLNELDAAKAVCLIRHEQELEQQGDSYLYPETLLREHSLDGVTTYRDLIASVSVTDIATLAQTVLQQPACTVWIAPEGEALITPITPSTTVSTTTATAVTVKPITPALTPTTVPIPANVDTVSPTTPTVTPTPVTP